MNTYKEYDKVAESRPVAVVLTVFGLCAGLMTEGRQVLGAEPIVRDCVTAGRFNVRRPPPPALDRHQIRGFVTSPRLSTFNAGPDPSAFAFTFSGSLNAEPHRWRIEVDALRSANLDPNEKETGGVANWQHVTTFEITGGGPDAFTFSQAGVHPFKDLPEAWKPGGLGRLRVVATMKGTDEDRNRCAFLPALDSDGLDPANAATIVVADGSVDPTKPLGQTDDDIRNPFNEHTPNYLSARSLCPDKSLPPCKCPDGLTPDFGSPFPCRDPAVVPPVPPVLSFLPDPNDPDPAAEERRAARQRTNVDAYYRGIFASDSGTGASVRRQFPTLERFIAHYFREFEGDCVFPDPVNPDQLIENEREQVAQYFNKGDLGIGREMHCIYRACTAELACYVRNFGGIGPDGKVVFGDKTQVERELLANRPFATVAMVERGIVVERGLARQERGLSDLPNSVFFVVYDANGNLYDRDGNLLVDKAPLDNKGYNTSIPGNCLQCHGISSRYITRGSRPEVTNAIFLPFDLNAFEFFNEDPDDPLSRAYQEPVFRALNRMVLRSAIGRSPAAREVIEGWYQGDLSDAADHTFRNFVPEGWRNANDMQGQPDLTARLHQLQLYSNFIAVGCRTCHISAIVPGTLGARNLLSFSRQDHFLPFVQTQKVKDIVCSSSPPIPAERHFMPAAEQTLKVLWQSEGRQHFFAQLPGQFGDCGP